MAAPTYVYTVDRVARMLGETVKTLEEFAEQLEPEDGCLSIVGLDDNILTLGFTRFGVDNLKEIIADQRPSNTSE